MNWSRIREHNRRATSRKNERERKEATHNEVVSARVEELGGTFTVSELRTAEVKVTLLTHPRRGDEPHVVWTLRGREWMLHTNTGNEIDGLMLTSDLLAWESIRPVIAPRFASVAAKNFAVEKTNEVWSKYETTGSEPVATTLF